VVNDHQDFIDRLFGLICGRAGERRPGDKKDAGEHEAERRKDVVSHRMIPPNCNRSARRSRGAAGRCRVSKIIVNERPNQPPPISYYLRRSNERGSLRSMRSSRSAIAIELRSVSSATSLVFSAAATRAASTRTSPICFV